MGYKYIYLVAALILFYLNINTCMSITCDASGKIINVVSGDEYIIEFENNSDYSISDRVENVNLADIIASNSDEAIAFANAELLNQIVCVKDIFRDRQGNISCTIYKILDGSPLSMSFNKILVKLDYAKMQENQYDSPISNNSVFGNIIYERETPDDYENIEVIDNPGKREIKNSSPVW